MNEQLQAILVLVHDCEVSWAKAMEMTAMSADDDRYNRARAVLEAALKELEADAARYQFLRDNGSSGDHFLVVARLLNESLVCEVSDYDMTIDAAIKRSVEGAP